MFFGFFEAEFVEIFHDKIEKLPGDIYIEQQDIKQAVSGEGFEIFAEYGTEKCGGIPFDDFWHYYQIWDNYHYFGLHNGIPANEQPWYLDWIKTCQRWHEQCKAYAQNQKTPHVDK